MCVLIQQMGTSGSIMRNSSFLPVSAMHFMGSNTSEVSHGILLTRVLQFELEAPNALEAPTFKQLNSLMIALYHVFIFFSFVNVRSISFTGYQYRHEVQIDGEELDFNFVISLRWVFKNILVRISHKTWPHVSGLWPNAQQHAKRGSIAMLWNLKVVSVNVPWDKSQNS